MVSAESRGYGIATVQQWLARLCQSHHYLFILYEEQLTEQAILSADPLSRHIQYGGYGPYCTVALWHTRITRG